MRKIVTLWDARCARYEAEAAAELRAERAELRARLRRAQRRLAKFGGLIHQETVTRLQAQLEAL